MAIVYLPHGFIARSIPAGRGRYEAAHAHAAKLATAIAATVRPMTDLEFCKLMASIERALLKQGWRRDKRIERKVEAIAAARLSNDRGLAPD